MMLHQVSDHGACCWVLLILLRTTFPKFGVGTFETSSKLGADRRDGTDVAPGRSKAHPSLSAVPMKPARCGAGGQMGLAMGACPGCGHTKVEHVR